MRTTHFLKTCLSSCPVRDLLTTLPYFSCAVSAVSAAASVSLDVKRRLSSAWAFILVCSGS
ncbi:MAG: hypothetical protein RI989_646, partial [Bacteroidota bacterium]